MHNERETAGIECGTDQFGDNSTKKGGNKISETLRSKLSECLGLSPTQEQFHVIYFCLNNL